MSAVAARSGTPASGSRVSGPARIFIGLLLGILIGWLAPSFAVSVRPFADLFLRLIKMIVAPLLTLSPSLASMDMTVPAKGA